MALAGMPEPRARWLPLPVASPGPAGDPRDRAAGDPDDEEQAPPAAPGILRAADAVDRGASSPRAALESIIACRRRGDGAGLARLLTVPPEARARIQALLDGLPPGGRAAYARPEDLAASLIANLDCPAWLRLPLPGDGDGPTRGRRAVLGVEVHHDSGTDRRHATESMAFVREGGAWRWEVPAREAASLADYYAGVSYVAADPREARAIAWVIDSP